MSTALVVCAHPDDVDAQRDLAHVQWLHLGQTEQALPALDRLAQAGDPVARTSRMIIARSRADVVALQPLALAALRDAAAAEPKEPKGRLVLTLAEYAARQLGHDHGDLPDDDRRVRELYDKLAPRALPFAVAQPLMSLRAAIARRHGEDYKPFYEQQGCVQQWAAGPMQGSRGVVELSRLPIGEGPLDDDADVVPLACVVRLWNPTPSPGARRAITHVEAEGGPVLLNLGSDEPSRFYVDGTLVHRTDGIDRYEAKRVLLRLTLSAGWHRIEIHTTIPGERAWILTRALEEDGRPLPVSASAPDRLAEPFTGRPRRVRGPWPEAVPGIEGPIYAPLRAFLSIEDALADAGRRGRDGDSVELGEEARCEEEAGDRRSAPGC